ncbi:SCP2 sterol-binding domain-containing protein [Kushneria phosphatilytica]|uniref:SCP2 sterol-binding domain-containing protein n=1 Tax=Kushneria phosphatilytica TaxID=657387 RepID=A0A1S1NWF1_9GAMM|nr:SCP2 sterol-binding domain-containing protein [Kushneria phosphatilytica]OHV11892.1 hypothetical protein BH688_04185 [Kushneria phosphatilytica]QEL11066.1 SCP2 sterol-binding domain-containing protein [Kushneria phosphatilytica]
MYNSTTLIAELKNRFDSSAARGLQEVLQLELDEGDTWHMIIDNGELHFVQGIHEAPAATLFTSAETLARLIRHELGGIQAVMSRQVRVRGDIMLVARLSRLFDNTTP